MKTNTGLIPGLIAIFLATVGIISFGFIFIPLAAFVTLIGLFISFGNLSLSGIATNILALILTAIGLLTSPVLIGIIGASLESQSSTTKTVENSKQTAIDLIANDVQKQKTVSNNSKNKTDDVLPLNISIHNDKFQDEAMIELGAIIINFEDKCRKDIECALNGFKIQPIDLNIDAGTQYLVTNNDYCGAGGCTTMLVRKGINGEMEILAGNFGKIEPIKLSGNSHTGIRLINKHYKEQGGFSHIKQDFAWSGTKFAPASALTVLTDQ